MTDISIIIVTYDHQTETIECLKSLLTSLSLCRAQIIIVDNASRDNTVKKVEALQHQFKPQHNFLIIKNNINEGFTKAVNQGLALSGGEYILILNPDTQLSPDTFPALINIFENNKNCGIVSPQFRNPDGSIQPSCRRFPRHRDLFFYALALNKIFPKSKRFNYWHMGDFDFRSRRKVHQPQGAFLLTRRVAVEYVGFLDEKFPMFFSDVDWCRRFINKGWEIIFLPDVKIIHYQGSSIFKHRVKMICSSHRSFYYYFVKYYSGKRWLPINSITGILLIFLALMRSLFYLLTNNSK